MIFSPESTPDNIRRVIFGDHNGYSDSGLPIQRAPVEKVSVEPIRAISDPDQEKANK